MYTTTSDHTPTKAISLFPGTTQNYDYALVRISPVDFTANPDIRPVCLPTNPGENYSGKNAVTAGWGYLKGESSSIGDLLIFFY